jgi:hypothetical protein
LKISNLEKMPPQKLVNFQILNICLKFCFPKNFENMPKILKNNPKEFENFKTILKFCPKNFEKLSENFENTNFENVPKSGTCP